MVYFGFVTVVILRKSVVSMVLLLGVESAFFLTSA
jgi:hypothetical protein